MYVETLLQEYILSYFASSDYSMTIAECRKGLSRWHVTIWGWIIFDSWIQEYDRVFVYIFQEE